jgi:hypothetical protein
MFDQVRKVQKQAELQTLFSLSSRNIFFRDKYFV